MSRIAFILSDADAAVVQRALDKAHGNRQVSISDRQRLVPLERRLREARTGQGQARAAVLAALGYEVDAHLEEAPDA